MTASREFYDALAAYPSFADHLDDEMSHTLDRLGVMQVNVGRRCNLACRHCHVEAGPDRTEAMSRTTMEQVLKVVSDRGFATLDITGGAPEMNPSFEWLIRQAAALDVEVIVRSNLVILHEPQYAHLPELYAQLGITLFASLPHYTAKPVDKQRGAESFGKIISMLQRLNELGYGKGCSQGGDKKLTLNLVFNPSGAFLPPDQSALEKEYKQKLRADFGIEFDNLFAITNNPNGRFGELLFKSGNLEGYMGRLMGAFNPAAVPGMMCRNQLSVGWDGRVFDCDFNQAANMPCLDGRTIADYAANPDLPLRRAIAFGNHCYACTAGAGSSCGGATA